MTNTQEYITLDEVDAVLDKIAEDEQYGQELYEKYFGPEEEGDRDPLTQIVRVVERDPILMTMGDPRVIFGAGFTAALAVIDSRNSDE